MAGHSKWSNIKNKKSKTDAERSKLFTKIGRQIAVAVKHGGNDPEMNPSLRDAIENAKAANMPNDNIKRSIKRASGELGSINYEEIVYEGYGPKGVAVIIQLLSDNRNRTAGEMRYILDRCEGSLGASGCVSWMFDRKGLIVIEDSDDIEEEDLMMEVIEAGGEDMELEEDIYEILTDPTELAQVREKLEEKGYTVASSELVMLPQNLVKLEGEDYEQALALFDKLEEHDDVQNIYHNLEIIEE